jgi:hypothetical protein
MGKLGDVRSNDVDGAEGRRKREEMRARGRKSGERRNRDSVGEIVDAEKVVALGCGRCDCWAASTRVYIAMWPQWTGLNDPPRMMTAARLRGGGRGDRKRASWGNKMQVAFVKPHTSHTTPHTSHLTPHTSHLTPHTSQYLRVLRQRGNAIESPLQVLELRRRARASGRRLMVHASGRRRLSHARGRQWLSRQLRTAVDAAACCVVILG